MSAPQQSKFRAKMEQLPLWVRFLVMPFYFTACAWKLQAVFTLIGALMVLKDYAFYRSGQTPQFDWWHSLSTAIIPPLIIPAISTVYVVVFILRTWSARRRGGSS